MQNLRLPQKTRAIWLLITAALSMPWLAQAWASDDLSVTDKSQYTLFNPVPDELMRSFSTDRPAKANTATTVDAGHFQYESDILNWTYDRYNSSHMTTSGLMIISPVLKLGLTEHTDLELATTPVNITSTTERTSDTHNAAFGFGDTAMRLKVNFLGNEGGDYALAIVPYVKAPTADQHVGNGRWEGGGYAPFTVALPSDWSVTLQTEFDIQENVNLDGVHPNYQNLVNFEHTIIGDVSGQIEFWSDVDTDRDAPSTQYTFDLAAIWAVGGNLQLDAGANIGLNKAAPDLQLYTGISQRF